MHRSPRNACTGLIEGCKLLLRFRNFPPTRPELLELNEVLESRVFDQSEKLLKTKKYLLIEMTVVLLGRHEMSEGCKRSMPVDVVVAEMKRMFPLESL